MAKDKNKKKNAEKKSIFSFFKPSPKDKKEQKPYDEDSVFNKLAPYIFTFLGIFLAITYLFSEKMSIVGMLAQLLFNLFGYAYWVLPFTMFLVAARWKNDAPKRLIKYRFICSGLFLIFFSAFQ